MSKIHYPLLAVGLLASQIATAHAETPNGALQAPAYDQGVEVAAELLPDFLSHAEVEFLSPEELEQTRGTGIPRWMINLAVKEVTKHVGKAAGTKLALMLTKSTPPSYAEYKKAFGSRTAFVLSLLPALLKPQIAG